MAVALANVAVNVILPHTQTCVSLCVCYFIGAEVEFPNGRLFPNGTWGMLGMEMQVGAEVL